MRDSYFTTQIQAVLVAIKSYEGDAVSMNHQASGPISAQPKSVSARNEQIEELLDLIQKKLLLLLSDDRTPEREWRKQVSEPLEKLADLLRVLGRPTPTLEQLANDMAA